MCYYCISLNVIFLGMNILLYSFVVKVIIYRISLFLKDNFIYFVIFGNIYLFLEVK